MERNSSVVPKKRILVAVLNWGLGHAARCIPLITALRAAEHEVIIAADGRAGMLLQIEFPSLAYIELPAYNVRYGSSNMILNIAWQWPKILYAAFKEHRKVRDLINHDQLDLIISDSRFGCFSAKVKSIFISHQIWIKTPFPFLSFLVNHCNHWVIRRFNECWIPDWLPIPRLAGDLSRPIPNHPHRYLGILSRMTQKLEGNTWKRYSIVAILSGPEPQRTRFEQIIIEQAQHLDQPLLLIQGKAEVEVAERREGQVILRSFATGQELNAILLKADLVLCRSGYSSIMDLVGLNKRAVLVPTPGQTEQEYLAEICYNKGWFYHQAQEEFDLQKALANAKQYAPNPKIREVVHQQELLKEAVRSLNS